jgi:hypothetical protein
MPYYHRADSKKAIRCRPVSGCSRIQPLRLTFGGSALFVAGPIQREVQGPGCCDSHSRFRVAIIDRFGITLITGHDRGEASRPDSLELS